MTRQRMAARSVRRLVVLLVSLCVCGWAHASMDTTAHLEEGAVFVPRPAQARFFALGFEAVVSDYYWLQAVQIVGFERAGVGDTAQRVAKLIDVVTTLDPWVGHPYRFAAVWLTDTLEDVLATNRLLERGIAYHPGEWRNRFLLGFNYFFYLEDNARASEVLEQAAALPQAPGYTRLLVARLRSEASGLETAAAFLHELVQHEAEPYARTQYQVALDEIETERRARFLDRTREEFRRRNGRDIRDVGELVRGPRPVLKRLPPAHPILKGWQWRLDPETGRIVSSYYENRYRLHVHALDRQRRERWRPQLNQEAGGA